MEGEIIIVDDNSPDGTGTIADILSKNNDNIKVIHRKIKRGLSTAVVAGLEQSRGEIIGVMDADLSHPPEVIPELVRPIIDGESDFVVASRYKEQEKIKKWPLSRKIISWGGTKFARPLTKVSDPMSGFFFFKKDIIDGVQLTPIGYKIMLEIIVKGKHKNIKEVTFTFRNRYKGESKLNRKEYYNYIQHLIRLYIYTFKKYIM